MCGLDLHWILERRIIDDARLVNACYLSRLATRDTYHPYSFGLPRRVMWRVIEELLRKRDPNDPWERCPFIETLSMPIETFCAYHYAVRDAWDNFEASSAHSWRVAVRFNPTIFQEEVEAAHKVGVEAANSWEMPYTEQRAAETVLRTDGEILYKPSKYERYNLFLFGFGWDDELVLPCIAKGLPSGISPRTMEAGNFDYDKEDWTDPRHHSISHSTLDHFLAMDWDAHVVNWDSVTSDSDGEMTDGGEARERVTYRHINGRFSCAEFDELNDILTSAGVHSSDVRIIFYYT